MNKIANVIFAYSPKNDDELELTVGDRIEVIGFEEEGWWKGKLRGRIGVFPENFVQLVDAEDSQGLKNQTANKLNTIFGSRVSSKNSLSSNSLNTTNHNNNDNHNLSTNGNNKISISNNNLIMNNTHQQHDADTSNEYPYTSESMHSASSPGESRPKPVKGIGYGDIFAAGVKTKPLPADPPVTRPPFAKASERPSANNLASTLQKSIPKKPPPPAPIDNGNTNGSGPEHAPALPPKPVNQFNPLIHQRAPPKTKLARVIYAYKPANDDELELEVGDVIGVLETNIEDPGWWRGELRGRVGVFPDNFVELIEPVAQNRDCINQANIAAHQANGGLQPTVNSNSSLFNQQAQPQVQPQNSANTEMKPVLKSVFAGTPKGFSKELESNLEKHTNPASFLSLKRNKLQQQMTSSVGSDNNLVLTSDIDSTLASSNTKLDTSDSSDKQNGHGADSSESSPGKLNHITANRAKGPTRRPPSNLLNKRNQLNDLTNDYNKQEYGETKEEAPPASLPVFNHATTAQPQNDHTSLASLPSEQPHKNISPIASRGSYGAAYESQIHPKMNSPPNNNQQSENGQLLTPKTNQRTNQGLSLQPDNKSRLSSDSSPSTPPWMVELRKTNAEKKRDPLPTSTASLIEAIVSNPAPVPSTQQPVASTPTITTSAAAIPQALITAPVVVSTTTQTTSIPTNENTQLKHDQNLKLISREFTNEIDILKSEVKKLHDELKGVRELREAFEIMKADLKTCQSATENQRRYIKELVTNLADERKKIAAMQVEIEKNLK